MYAMNELIASSARDIVERLRKKEITPFDLIDAAVARIEVVDGAVNAVPTLCVERARECAGSHTEQSLLCGLPILVKDLVDVAGVRTTYGSPIFRDHVPEASNFLIDRLESNGAVVLGKSNTPEWGAGANTFNEVFGKTVNPYDTALSCGGSSGGSAVALSTGMAWLATGSDLGGSLRHPGCVLQCRRSAPVAWPGAARTEPGALHAALGRRSDGARRRRSRSLPRRHVRI